MIGFLDSLNGEERIIGDLGDVLRLWQSRLAPDLRRVATIAEVLQALRKAQLLGLKRRELKGRVRAMIAIAVLRKSWMLPFTSRSPPPVRWRARPPQPPQT